jgi:hypothetical protein
MKIYALIAKVIGLVRRLIRPKELVSVKREFYSKGISAFNSDLSIDHKPILSHQVILLLRFQRNIQFVFSTSSISSEFNFIKK